MIAARRAALRLLTCCALLTGPATVTACAARPAVICAGQCSAPYSLDVAFKAGTPAPTARAVLARCGHDPVVVRIGKLSANNGRWAGILYTRVLGRGVRTSALLHCLTSSDTVIDAAWPD